MSAGHPLRIGLKLSRGEPIDSYLRVWRIADESGFDHCWAFDHLVTSAGGVDLPLYDGWTLLAAMARETKRVRMGLIVTAMTYRHPALLAKIAVTVDHLSNGRLEFGIGSGWVVNEHEMFGAGELDHQVGRFSEGMQVIKLLWTRERSDFDGRFYRLKNATGNPRPIQSPHPPIWIGSGGPGMLRQTARHADVWNPASGDTVDDAKALGSQLVEACGAIGRDPATIRWSAQFGFSGDDPGKLLDEMRQWHEAGFTELVISCSGQEPVRAAEVAAEQVLPRLRQLV